MCLSIAVWDSTPQELEEDGILQSYLSDISHSEASREPPPAWGTLSALETPSSAGVACGVCRGTTWILSAEGGDLGRHESCISMSLPSEGVRGLLILLTLLEWPCEGLQILAKLTLHPAAMDQHQE